MYPDTVNCPQKSAEFYPFGQIRLTVPFMEDHQDFLIVGSRDSSSPNLSR